MKEWKKKVKKHLEEVLEIKTSPHSIAAGFAIGTLIAILPTFGLGLFIGIIILFIFKRISKLSMFASFAVWNPLIIASLYPISYAIGDIVLKNHSPRTYKIEILNQIFIHSRRFLFGSTILAITTAIAGYLLILILIDSYQRKKLKGFKEEVRELKNVMRIK